VGTLTPVVARTARMRLASQVLRGQALGQGGVRTRQGMRLWTRPCSTKHGGSHKEGAAHLVLMEDSAATCEEDRKGLRRQGLHSLQETRAAGARGKANRPSPRTENARSNDSLAP